MKMRRLHIHNYRSVKDSDIDMQDYSLLVGSNNVGKSNVIDAIRCFYEDIKFEPSDLCNKHDPEDRLCWIDVIFDLTDDEYDSLKEEYKIEKNKLKVRKLLVQDGERKPAIYGYTAKGMEDSPFYGAKNVQQGKLGHIVYVPAILDVKENTKLTGSSSLRNLLEIAFNSTLEKDVNYQEVAKSINKLTNSMKAEGSGALSKLETDINNELDDWGININFKLRTPSANDILKNMLDYNMQESDQEISLERLGTGFQRHFIYNLIKLSSNYTEVKEKKDKDFTPNMTLLLFEEPEVFLHPTAQENLSLYLRKFASHNTNQVLISTHSSQFVSMNIMDIYSIIRLEKQDDITHIYQMKLSIDELEKCKNLVFFDRPRSDLFFATKVILVEGATEYMFFNYIKQKNLIDTESTTKVCCIDTLGKQSMPYFIKILKNFHIKYSVLWDLDTKPNVDPMTNQHNKAIVESFDELKEYHYCFERNIEVFLTGEEWDHNGNKVVSFIRKIENGDVSDEKKDQLIQIFQDLITKQEGLNE